jgi:hypothetical protein
MGFVRRYLNSKERLHLILISGFIGEIKETIDEWTSLKKNKAALKYLRAGLTLTQKGLDAICSEITVEEYNKVYKLATTAHFHMSYTPYKEPKTASKYTIEDEASMIEVAAAAYDGRCVDCKGVENCMLQKIYQAWEVPVMDEVTDRCPYLRT